MASDEVKFSVLHCPQCGANLPPSGNGYLVCQYCGSSLIMQGKESAPGEANAANAVRGMRMKQLICTDPQGTGLELFRMLIPAGWNFTGGCNWLMNNPGMPATIEFQVSNPQGAEMFSVFPSINLVWSTDPFATVLHPIGSHYFGAEVRPPMHISQALRELVLPRNRAQIQNLQILADEPQPDLPKLAKSEAPLVGGYAEGGKLRIRYNQQGSQFDEEIYGIVENFRVPQQSLFGTNQLSIWYINFVLAFRTAPGLLDAPAKLFLAIITSFKLNPHWHAALKSIAQVMAKRQIQHIQSIGEIGHILAAAGSQMREQNLNDWYARQETYDRLSTDWSRTIRGVDAFFDPHSEKVIELPSGYGQAWANNLGEYVLTDDPNFNPNIHSTQHWEPMKPQ